MAHIQKGSFLGKKVISLGFPNSRVSGAIGSLFTELDRAEGRRARDCGCSPVPATSRCLRLGAGLGQSLKPSWAAASVHPSCSPCALARDPSVHPVFICPFLSASWHPVYPPGTPLGPAAAQANHRLSPTFLVALTNGEADPGQPVSCAPCWGARGAQDRRSHLEGRGGEDSPETQCHFS